MIKLNIYQFSWFGHSVISWLFVTPWTAACQSSLSITNFQSLLKLMSIESVVPFNHLVLCHPLILPPSTFPRMKVFPMSLFFASGSQSIGVSVSATVLPINVQCWFPLGLTGLISLQSKGGLTRVFSNTAIQKHQFLALSLLYGPPLHDYWKNHSFNCIDLCQQSDVSAF